MAAGTTPIFPLTPNFDWGPTVVSVANVNYDGTGTTVLVFTAGANGARVDALKVKALGTNVATVLRVFVNNGSTPATAANNALFAEQTIAATTASQTAALADTEIPLNISLEPGQRIYCSVGTAISAGLMVSTVGGDY